MALKYGSKSGGFGLRSGKGVPFKSMGSSPAKGGIMDILGAFGGAKQADKFASQTPKVETTISPPGEDATVEGVSQKAIKGPQVSKKGIDAIKEVTTKGREEHGDLPWDKDYDPTKDAHKGTKTDMNEFRKNTVVVDGKTYDKGEEPRDKPKKHQAQIRKQKRLDKITARRKKKGKEGLSSRQIRLQGEVDKTAEQFVSDRKAKLQKAGDFAIQIGRQISGDSKGITTSLEDSTANRLNEAANAKKVALQKTVDNKEAVLPKTIQGAVTAEGANLEPAKITQAKISEQRIKEANKYKNPDGTWMTVEQQMKRIFG